MNQREFNKLLKVVSKVDRKLKDLENMLRDMSMKLCHVIKRRGHYSVSEGPLQT